MDVRRVYCGGKEYDWGFTDGCYYRALYRPALTGERRLAYLAGYVTGTNARHGESWTIDAAEDRDLVIRRLTELPEIACEKTKQELRLIDIECGSDQDVEAYLLDPDNLILVAGPGAIVGVPNGIFQISSRGPVTPPLPRLTA